MGTISWWKWPITSRDFLAVRIWRPPGFSPLSLRPQKPLPQTEILGGAPVTWEREMTAAHARVPAKLQEGLGPLFNTANCAHREV